MTRLSVNVNKIATLRNARGKDLPNLLEITQKIISYGASGITVHPRPDGRHIRRDDVFELSEKITVEFNIEGFPSKDFINLIAEVRPTQCTLVPDPPEVITSNAGWKVKNNAPFLKETIKKLNSFGVRTSLFVDPHDLTAEEVEILQSIGVNRAELYTEAYADAYNTADQEIILRKYCDCAGQLSQAGIGLNAGHDLNLENLSTLVKAIGNLDEVSIGHALICDALEMGMEKSIERYLACL